MYVKELFRLCSKELCLIRSLLNKVKDMLAPISVILQISMLTMTDTCVLQRLLTNVGCHEKRGSKERDITPVSCYLTDNGKQYVRLCFKSDHDSHEIKIIIVKGYQCTIILTKRSDEVWNGYILYTFHV